MEKGRLYLVPAALSENKPSSFLPPATLEIVYELSNFIAERAKTARHYLKDIGYPKSLNEAHVEELNKHGQDDYYALLQPCLNGQDIALLSEAGVPAVADPGWELVQFAHALQIEVVPLVGPSSILLALMASGFNGQRFAFHGYLAKDDHDLAKQLKQLEAESRSQNVTQIFIETPYRNHKMLDALLRHLTNNCSLSIAINLTSDDQKIISKTVSEWKKSKINFDRKPAVFLIYAGK